MEGHGGPDQRRGNIVLSLKCQWWYLRQWKGGRPIVASMQEAPEVYVRTSTLRTDFQQVGALARQRAEKRAAEAR